MNELKEMTVVDGLNLLAAYEAKEKELAVIEAKLKEFKAEMFRQLEAAGLENIRKSGYNFTIVKPKRTVINDAIAWDLIVAAGKLPERYTVIDKNLFMVDFGKENAAITQVDSTPYLKITEVKK